MLKKNYSEMNKDCLETYCHLYKCKRNHNNFIKSSNYVKYRLDNDEGTVVVIDEAFAIIESTIEEKKRFDDIMMNERNYSSVKYIGIGIHHSTYNA